MERALLCVIALYTPLSLVIIKGRFFFFQYPLKPGTWYEGGERNLTLH